jgi:hypothetical protein
MMEGMWGIIMVEDQPAGAVISVTTDKGAQFTVRLVDPSRCMVSVAGLIGFQPGQVVKIDGVLERRKPLSVYPTEGGARPLGTVIDLDLNTSPDELVVSFVGVDKATVDAIMRVVGGLPGTHVAHSGTV